MRLRTRRWKSGRVIIGDRAWLDWLSAFRAGNDRPEAVAAVPVASAPAVNLGWQMGFGPVSHHHENRLQGLSASGEVVFVTGRMSLIPHALEHAALDQMR